MCGMALKCSQNEHPSCITYGIFYLASRWTATGQNPVSLAPVSGYRLRPTVLRAVRVMNSRCHATCALLLVHGCIIALACKQVSRAIDITRVNDRVISLMDRKGLRVMAARGCGSMAEGRQSLYIESHCALGETKGQNRPSLLNGFWGKKTVRCGVGMDLA